MKQVEESAEEEEDQPHHPPLREEAHAWLHHGGGGGVAVGDSAPELTPHEAALFGALRALLATTDCRSVLRVAGGWVRDKVLCGEGAASCDVDLVVDNMPAAEFAALLLRHGCDSLGAQGGKVIASRPEQHKSIEVVALKLGGLAVELSSYLGRSLTEEAMRRDFTINSLFYNINHNRIEDCTGMGLLDLRAGLIRTPLPAMETLGNDPLRVLRAIRFAARFGFTIAPDLARAMQDATILDGMKSRISRQRLSAEVIKIVTGPQPQDGLLALCEYGIHRIVFAPSRGHGFWTEELTQLACSSIRLCMVQYANETRPLSPGISLSAYLLAALFLPLCFASSGSPPERGGKKPHLPFTKWDMREYWKFSDQDTTTVFLLITRAHQLEDLAVSLDTSSPGHRQAAARLLHEIGPAWMHCLGLARVLEALRLRGACPAAHPDEAPLALPPSGPVPRLREWIESSGLVDPPVPVWGVEPLVRPRELLAAMADRNAAQLAGADVRRLVSLALDWQLARHPVAPSAEATGACLAWVVSEWARLHDHP